MNTHRSRIAIALLPSIVLSLKGGFMTKRILGGCVAVLLGVSMAMAAGPREYQVTGPVLEVTNDVITVEKDKDKWEIARDKDTKIKGELKKGSRVTIKYTMTATNVEVKDAGKGKSDDKKKSDEKSKSK